MECPNCLNQTYQKQNSAIFSYSGKSYHLIQTFEFCSYCNTNKILRTETSVKDIQYVHLYLPQQN